MVIYEADETPKKRRTAVQRCWRVKALSSCGEAFVHVGLLDNQEVQSVQEQARP